MDQYELLIRHAESWAAKTKRPLDPELLGTALSLRDEHDRVAGTSWPEGSADYLMTVRWPGHGPLGVPDTDALVATLDTFWRFLRATGRMASGSADPKALTREARRAIPLMRELCDDTTAYGSAKGLLAYGQELGISVDDAGSLEEVQARMDRIVEAWNSMSIEERRSRMPGPTGAGSLLSEEMSAQINQLLADSDYREYDGPELWGDDDDLLLEPQDPTIVADQIRQSGYMKAVMRLLEWIGPKGKGTTPDGYLRPAAAREAVAALQLDEWMVSALDSSLGTWDSAADHLGLDRLYTPAIVAGLLEVRGNRVLPKEPGPESDDDWSLAGIVALCGLSSVGEDPVGLQLLMGVLVGLTFGDMHTVEDIYTEWSGSDADSMPHELPAGFDDEAEFEALIDEATREDVDWMLAYWADTGIWRRLDDQLTITELGMELLRVLDRALTYEDDDLE